MDHLQLGIWLAAFFISVGTALLLLAWLLLGLGTRTLWSGALVATSLVFCLLGTDALDSLAPKDQATRFGMELGIIVLTGLGLLVHWSLGRQLRDAPNRNWSHRGAAVAWHLALVGGVAWRFYAVTTPVMEVRMDELQARLVERPGITLVTDEGRPVPVYDVAIEATDTGSTESNLSGFGGRLIRRSQPDAQSNCHGWVFTGGRYLLMGTGVERILADNGYARVDEPQAGDVVVYRNLAGRILHTGLVRGVLDDRNVMVESKWGLGGRFLHLAEDQAYSPYYSFYRSSRASHQVHAAAGSAAQVAQVAANPRR